MVYNNILEAMGHTPLVRLNHLAEENAAEILVKVEGLNVGGSLGQLAAIRQSSSCRIRSVRSAESWCSITAPRSF